MWGRWEIHLCPYPFYPVRDARVDNGKINSSAASRGLACDIARGATFTANVLEPLLHLRLDLLRRIVEISTDYPRSTMLNDDRASCVEDRIVPRCHAFSVPQINRDGKKPFANDAVHPGRGQSTRRFYG